MRCPAGSPTDNPPGVGVDHEGHVGKACPCRCRRIRCWQENQRAKAPRYGRYRRSDAGTLGPSRRREGPQWCSPPAQAIAKPSPFRETRLGPHVHRPRRAQPHMRHLHAHRLAGDLNVLVAPVELIGLIRGRSPDDRRAMRQELSARRR